MAEKLTDKQGVALWATMHHGNPFYHRKWGGWGRSTSMGGAVARMAESLQERGLMGERWSVTAAGLEAFIAWGERKRSHPELTAGLDKARQLLPERAAAEEAERQRVAQAAAEAESSWRVGFEARQAARAAAFREILSDLADEWDGMSPAEIPDSAILAALERIPA